MIPSPFPAILRIVSGYQGKYLQKKKEERKTKNADKTQTKLNAIHFWYNVKTLPQ